jgi:short-subunit dehydrogenase
LISAKGYPVALIARREERLNNLAQEIESMGGRAYPLAADLASPSALKALPNRIRALGYPLGVLINNAGFAWYGFGDEMSWDIAGGMIAVNVAAATYLTLAFLPGMIASGRGHVINMGSIAGSIPSQGVALYSATKSFLDAFTTSLYRELKGTKVYVSVVRAGAVATPFYQKVADQSGNRRIPVERLAIPPGKIAERVVDLVRRPRRVIYMPRWLRFVPWIELSFGWLIDKLGPALLRLKTHRRV